MMNRLRQEDGIALVFALAFSVTLSILVFGMTEYVTSNQHNAKNSSVASQATAYAEAALDTAYSRIQYANSTNGSLSGLNPAKPSLLGCGTGSNGASDCSTISPLCISFTASCPTSGTYSPTAGTGSVYGYYTGTNAGSFSGLSEPSSTWVVVGNGYSTNASGKLVAKSLRATVTVSAASAGAVASVWNHVFLTAPASSGVCQTTFSANSTVLDIPLYAIGNVCFGGNNVVMKEVAGGQAVDLQVGGKLVYGGNGDQVGDYSTNPATGITSGVVVGNCAATIGGAATDCATNFQYKVKAVGSFVSQDDPELTDTQAKSNYTSFDPGPKHTCLAGTTPSPLADTAFDNSIAAGEGSTALPDNTGSGSVGGVFDLTPSSSYACISKNGASTGYLIWNNASSGSITVSGVTVPSKTLAINGSIFFDSPIKISQTMTYKGTAVIMAAGQISFPTNNMSICAQNTSCVFTNWQGNSGNNDMMTLATVLKNSSSAINWTGNAITYQGSLWTSPTSTLLENGQGTPVLQGPMSVGSLNVIGNSFSFKPLPVIKNMPVGAPVPPNVSATISPLNIIG
jgi:Tfp pilus assembly protein PilX